MEHWFLLELGKNYISKFSHSVSMQKYDLKNVEITKKNLNTFNSIIAIYDL